MKTKLQKFLGLFFWGLLFLCVFHTSAFAKSINVEISIDEPFELEYPDYNPRFSIEPKGAIKINNTVWQKCNRNSSNAKWENMSENEAFQILKYKYRVNIYYDKISSTYDTTSVKINGKSVDYIRGGVSCVLQASDYGIYVNNGKAITLYKCDDVLGDGGSVKYDPGTRTLTLKNYNGEYIYSTKSIKIKLEDGTNNIISSGNNVGISVSGNLDIVGNGNLTLNCYNSRYGSHSGILAHKSYKNESDGNITINMDGNLIANKLIANGVHRRGQPGVENSTDEYGNITINGNGNITIKNDVWDRENGIQGDCIKILGDGNLDIEKIKGNSDVLLSRNGIVTIGRDGIEANNNVAIDGNSTIIIGDYDNNANTGIKANNSVTIGGNGELKINSYDEGICVDGNNNDCFVTINENRRVNVNSSLKSAVKAKVFKVLGEASPLSFKGRGGVVSTGTHINIDPKYKSIGSYEDHIIYTHDYYHVDVTNGSVTGEFTYNGDAVPDTEVTITAKKIYGKEFDRWEVTGTTVVDEKSKETTFKMPSNAVSATAIYKDVESSVSIDIKTPTENRTPNDVTISSYEREIEKSGINWFKGLNGSENTDVEPIDETTKFIINNDYSVEFEISSVEGKSFASDVSIRIDGGELYKVVRLNDNLLKIIVNFNKIDDFISVEIPKANENLVYNGYWIYGAYSGKGYNLEDNVEKNAGNYIAKAILLEGYKWSDGTREDKLIPWTIAKAEPEYILPTGLKGLRGAALASVQLPKGYTWVDGTTVIGSEEGGTYKAIYTPEDTTNYKDMEVNINVDVLTDMLIEEPTVKENLVYTGNPITGISEGTGYKIEGNVGTNAGDYIATATLFNGYKWSDGTTEVKTIPWTIAKKNPEYNTVELHEECTLENIVGAGMINETLSTLYLPKNFLWADDTVVMDKKGKNIYRAKYIPVDTENYNTVENINICVKVYEQVDEPKANTGLVYTGNPITGVNEGKGYKIIAGGVAVDAGNYIATVGENREEFYVFKSGHSYKNISWTIAKADPEYTVPTNVIGINGSTLSTVKLPKGFEWTDDVTTIIDTLGNHTYKAKYVPEDTKNYNTVEDIDITVKVLDGVTVSGTVKSYNSDTDDVIIELFKEGNETATYSTSVKGNIANYTIDGVEPGTYVMKISKANHITREYAIDVLNSNIEQDATINPKGDVTGDGKVNTFDIVKIKLYAKNKTGLDGYELLCADITGDGRVNTFDVVKAKLHAKKKQII